jgi:N-acylglucosamine-6-phosphate 2-epimerase
MAAMMKSVLNGGAGALRVAGVRDIKNAKKLSNVPVIGITKPNKIPSNYKEIVYITPTVQDVIDIINAGADIVAFDGTQRPRPNNEKIKDLIKYIHINKKLAMADISTVEEGIKAQEAGADILSTTLAGYTMESINSPSKEPDFKLLKELVEKTNTPVILEGRIWEPQQVDRAFEAGAHAVVIGSAITRPQLITKRFVFRGGKE